MWVRGLKRFGVWSPLQQKVAPYVGAWIETKKQFVLSQDDIVAPYVGAWIETSCR